MTILSDSNGAGTPGNRVKTLFPSQKRAYNDKQESVDAENAKIKVG